MPYRSVITSHLTKESLPPIVSQTFEEHKRLLQSSCVTFVEEWTKARTKLALACIPLTIAAWVCLLVSVVAFALFALAIVIYFKVAPVEYNPYMYERRTYAFVVAWRTEIRRSIMAPDAQILTPER